MHHALGASLSIRLADVPFKLWHTQSCHCLQSLDLSALSAQALAQVEKARKAAAESLASALNQKPKIDLTLELDAPKIAIPVPATDDGKGTQFKPHLDPHAAQLSSFHWDGLLKCNLERLAWTSQGLMDKTTVWSWGVNAFIPMICQQDLTHTHLVGSVGKLTLVADLGRFVLQSDTKTASSLPLEEASLYECLKLSGSNISAYLVDGDFCFSALEDVGRQKAPAPEDSEPTSSVSTEMTAAITQSQGKTLGGSAICIPLLERCGTSALLQAARFPHPSLPSTKLQLQVPKLRFFFSPARLGRILRAVDAVLPGTACLVCVRSTCHIVCTPGS